MFFLLLVSQGFTLNSCVRQKVLFESCLQSGLAMVFFFVREHEDFTFSSDETKVNPIQRLALDDCTTMNNMNNSSIYSCFNTPTVLTRSRKRALLLADENDNAAKANSGTALVAAVHHDNDDHVPRSSKRRKLAARTTSIVLHQSPFQQQEHQQQQHYFHSSPVLQLQQQQQQQASSPTTTPMPITDGTRGSNSDDTTPLPAEPLGTFSQFFHTQCVQECAQAAAGDDDDEDDSFLAVFDNPNLVAAGHRAGVAAGWPDHAHHHHHPQASSPRPLKGLTIRVHAPRQVLPSTGYEVQWQVDPPQFTGLYRVRATVVRERFEAQYPCSEIPGVPTIEVHQEGERMEIARLVCYRIRSRTLRQQYDTSWQTKYPAVARFLQAVGDNAALEEDESLALSSYYYPRGMVQSVSQLLLEDLYVHPEYRGGGLGLSLVDHACRKVGDALASIVLGLPPQQQQQEQEKHESSLLDAHALLNHHAPHDEPLVVASRDDENEEEEEDEDHDDEDEDDEDEDTVNPSTTRLEHYFGLLGFVHIHQDYMARAAGRVLLEEACPSAPVLDPNRIETY